MVLIPITECLLVAWPLHHTSICLGWEEVSAGNGSDVGEFNQRYVPANIFDAASSFMALLLSLFRLPYQRFLQPHRYGATLFRLSSSATVLLILVCVAVPPLVHLLL